jgi:hypothetical protein
MAVALCLIALGCAGVAYDASQREDGLSFVAYGVVSLLAIAGLYVVAH